MGAFFWGISIVSVVFIFRTVLIDIPTIKCMFKFSRSLFRSKKFLLSKTLLLLDKLEKLDELFKLDELDEQDKLDELD